MEEDNFEWITDPKTVKKFAIKSIIKLGEIVDLLEKKNPEMSITKSEYRALVRQLQPGLQYVTEGLIPKRV